MQDADECRRQQPKPEVRSNVGDPHATCICTSSRLLCGNILRSLHYTVPSNQEGITTECAPGVFPGTLIYSEGRVPRVLILLAVPVCVVLPPNPSANSY